MGKRAIFGMLGTALVGVLSLVGIGLGRAGIDPPARSGQVPVARFDSALGMSPEVKKLITRSCADCHSVGAELPWYAHVPPASWMVEKDMQRAQKAMSLSAWSTQNGRKPGVAIATFTAMCGDVQSGRMPDRKYLWMHPEARLSPSDVNTICNWTAEKISGLR